ncbi:MAG: hypothetical protein LOY04_13445, partial [Rhodococcus ruber]|nr:hypothetical protein [Rhodococcus ruber]
MPYPGRRAQHLVDLAQTRLGTDGRQGLLDARESRPFRGCGRLPGTFARARRRVRGPNPGVEQVRRGGGERRDPTSAGGEGVFVPGCRGDA